MSDVIHGSLCLTTGVFTITIGDSVHNLNRERAEALFALLDRMLAEKLHPPPPQRKGRAR